jgi:hypothetical protein
MAQFFFNIRDGEKLIRDPAVYRFSTAQRARDMAVKTMRDMIRANPDDYTFGKQIEIADAGTGHPVSVVRFYDVAPHLVN